MVILFLLLALPIFVGLSYALYWLLKRLGYPRVGKVLLSIVSILLGTLAFYTVFEDQFFSKSDAEKLLAEQNIELTDDFELLKNESMSANGDYYHTFTLKISGRDKQRIVQLIRNSTDFRSKEHETWIDDSLFREPNRYTGKKVICNYETDPFLIRELFEPHGVGYAPTFRKLKIDKKGNALEFEDIDE